MSQLHGFVYPRTATGRASIIPAPPWHYSGDVLTIEYRTDPERVIELLPDELEPADDPGAVALVWADWQSCSDGGAELLDPVRSQYREVFVVIRGRHDGAHVSRCAYIWVDRDFALVRGLFQGYPKKLGSIHMTRPVTHGRAGPRLAPGGRFGATLAAGDRRLPSHTRLRRLVQGGFTRRMVQSYESSIRTLAGHVLDEALPKGTFDFTIDVARQLPLRMLGRLLGAPEEDYDWLVSRGDAMIGNSDPEFTPHVVDSSDTEPYRLMPFRSPAGIELFEYAQRMADLRRAQPADDVISALLAPTSDGDPLSDHEFNNFFTLLVAAGNDTTRYSIAAGVLALIDHPDQLALLQEQPQLISSAVEEMLRWSSVTMHFRRTATRDVDLHGRRIREGDRVVMWFISGDYDERRFTDPFTFDVTRDPNPHLAFGRGGPHRCIGEWLARVEMQVTIEELLKRVSTIAVAGPAQRLRSNFISGIKHLPVTVTAA